MSLVILKTHPHALFHQFSMFFLNVNTLSKQIAKFKHIHFCDKDIYFPNTFHVSESRISCSALPDSHQIQEDI